MSMAAACFLTPRISNSISSQDHGSADRLPVSSGAACSSFCGFDLFLAASHSLLMFTGLRLAFISFHFFFVELVGFFADSDAGGALSAEEPPVSRPFIKALSKRASTGRCMLLIAPARASSASAGKVAGKATCGAGERSGAGSANDKAAVIPPAPVATTVTASFAYAYEPDGIVGIVPVVTLDPPPCACADNVLN